MNGNCQTCDLEKQCAYQYKPCDCRDYLKFKAIEVRPTALQEVTTMVSGQDEDQHKRHEIVDVNRALGRMKAAQ